MFFKILSLFFALFLLACNDNSEQAKIPRTETPDVETPGIETPGIETPDVETPDVETPGIETPGIETPEPEVSCITEHSPDITTSVSNHETNYVFFSSLSSDFLSSYNIATGEIVAGNESVDAQTRHYQRVVGNTLATQLADNNGQWFVGSNSLHFTNTVTGEIEQFSNLDINDQNICSIKQINPSFSREPELYINYGDSCDTSSKVHLAMDINASAIQLPNQAVAQGVSLYNTAGSWQGQLHKKTHGSSSRLVFSQPDYCSEKDVFSFSETNAAWYAKQANNGELLLRLEDQVYLLNSSDAQQFISASDDFVLPTVGLFTLSSKTAEIRLLQNNDYIFFYNVEGLSAELSIYDIATNKLLENQSIFVAGLDDEKTYLKFNHWLIDQHSLWLETRFQTTEENTLKNNSRFSRWDLTTKSFDLTAVLDHEIVGSNIKSTFYSVANKLYVKLNKYNGLYFPELNEDLKDYTLAPNTAPKATSDIWTFIKTASDVDTQADSVFALDYSMLASDQLQLKIIQMNGSEHLYPLIDRKVDLLFNDGQYGDYSVFIELSCSEGCFQLGIVQQHVMNVLLAKHSDASLQIIYSETCNITAENVATCSSNP